MSKIWKSHLAMKLCCPAYKSDYPDPCRMEVYKAKHELLRFQYRMEKLPQGLRIVESEMPIENEFVIGKTDDVFQSEEGAVIAVDYVSSYHPKMYKLIDAAISAGILRHKLDTYAIARVVSRGGVVDEPDDFVEDVWLMINSQQLQDLLSLPDDMLLKFANPASGICAYCANNECPRKPQ